MRLVRRRRHAAVARTDTEVVLSHLPPPRVGADASRGLGPLGRADRRAPGRGPDPGPADPPGLALGSPDLTTQLDDGRIYDRDLAGASVELRSLLEAYRRQQRISGVPYLS